ncbi:Bug family tripartite tricarboxylate transporter substrate binding protein [Roseateles toxinivorans]|uniref:Tripartite-type tricarboxylate transporter receptor subunit TctC n=1 Tax=Roseateles toxinivorans TaxID=270368 RepID=A0A4R6QQE0_9BURK|nr:tripartite tricarboxylate transporter substrate binding protein [Roseateles toxinivorans]TDP72355.1 tripartite-type tricarboxylate transporter receptor subunit TctC [Roseateles toxinivorans]
MQRRALWLTTLALLVGAHAQAQELPKKTLTVVVGFAAGGATDAAARIIAKKLQDNLGQTVVVENRAGAGGNIAHQYLAAAPADGSVILLGSIGPLTIAPHMMKVGYDPQKDLAPLTMGVSFPNVLVVHPGTGIKTFADFIAKAKAKPGTLDFASTGAGSASHLAGELLNQRAGIDTVHIPYKGGAPALQDLLGGRVAAYYAAPPTALPHIEAGKLIPIATTGPTRPAYMPNVPTIAESGYPGFNASNWYAFVAPGKTPVAVLERWNKELVRVLTTPQVRDELLKHGLTPAPGTREELASYIDSESRIWGKLVRDRKITAE